MSEKNGDKAAVAQPTKEEIDAGMAQIKAVYDDKFAMINGRRYDFSITSHVQRVKVFSFFSKVRMIMTTGDFSFLDTAEWRDVENTIERIVMFEGSTLGKLPTHWERYPEDYLLFVTCALGVISYPFMRGSPTA